MINEPPPFKGLIIRILIIIPIKGKGFINQGSGLLRLATGEPPSPQIPEVLGFRVWGENNKPWVCTPVAGLGFRVWGFRV